MNLIGFSFCLLSVISSCLTNSHCEEITLSWRLIKVLCKVSTLLVKGMGHKKFWVICSVKGNTSSLSWSLRTFLFLLVLVLDFVANELSQQDAACSWCCVRWGLSGCTAGIMNWLFFFLAWYTPWSEEKQSGGNPWYYVSNIKFQLLTLIFPCPPWPPNALKLLQLQSSVRCLSVSFVLCSVSGSLHGAGDWSV